MKPYIGGSRNFWKGGGVAAAYGYFCPLFGPERGVEALKIAKIDLFFGKIFRPKGSQKAKIDLFLVKFSDQGGGLQPCNPPPRSANVIADMNKVTRIWKQSELNKINTACIL